jgi:hypothetical protein
MLKVLLGVGGRGDVAKQPHHTFIIDGVEIGNQSYWTLTYCM